MAQGDPRKRARYDALRDEGKSHEGAVAAVEAEFAPRQEPTSFPVKPTSTDRSLRGPQTTFGPEPLKNVPADIAQGLTLGLAGALFPGIKKHAGQGSASAGVEILASVPLGMGLGRAVAGAKNLSKLSKGALATGSGVGAGAVSGATHAEPGHRWTSAILGGLLGGAGGAGAELISTVGRKGGRMVRTLLGKPSQRHLTEGTDEAFREWLTRTNQTPDLDVLPHAQRLREAGVPEVTVGEAMGPAGRQVAKAMGPLDPEPAGRAFSAGKDMLEKAKTRVSSPEVGQLYDEAKAVGALPLSKKGGDAWLQLRQDFPKVNGEILAYAEREGIPMNRLFTAEGDMTLEYADLFKQRIDADVYGRTLSQKRKDIAWVKKDKQSIEKVLRDFVDETDKAVRKVTGGSEYRDARRVAGAGIEEQNILRDTREGLGKELQKAAGRTRPEGMMEEAAAVAQFGADRPGPGLFQTLADPLRGGVRKTGRLQAGNTLKTLFRTDPEAAWEEIVRREAARQKGRVSGAVGRGVVGGSLGRSALEAFLLGR